MSEIGTLAEVRFSREVTRKLTLSHAKRADYGASMFLRFPDHLIVQGPAFASVCVFDLKSVFHLFHPAANRLGQFRHD